MKIKQSKADPIKLEKKNTSLFVLDLYIQREESFFISVLSNKFEYHKIYNNNDNIIIPGFYPRLKKTSFYNKEILKKISNQSILIKSLDNKIMPEEMNKNSDNNLDNTSNIENSIFDSSLKKCQSKDSEKNNEKYQKDLIIKEVSSNKISKSELSKICNINQEIKDLVYKEEKLKSNQIQIIKIAKDGNCFYRCLSYFLLKSQEYYKNIKNLIIEWIENNYEDFLEFFGDDDSKNLKKEDIAKNELDYIKSKDSWGSHYTFSIACLIFKIDIAVYTYEGNYFYKPYNLFKIDNDEKELCIMNYHNNYHFELIYSKNEMVEENTLYNSISEIEMPYIYKKNNIKITGTNFETNYVEINNLNSKNLYDEIYNFLLSIKQNEKEIHDLELQNKNWHYNQILSKFELIYPKRLEDKSISTMEKRKNFRKCIELYKLDKNNRLCILNKNLIKNRKDLYFKIPFKHEKDIIINDCHVNYNHCGRDNTYENVLNNNWYWNGMKKDIATFIKTCPFCNTGNKFKKLKGKNKIIIENGPHYRYVADIWTLPKEIASTTKYKYILDIVDHFSKWYYGYLLHTKEAKEILKNIEIFCENFGNPKILQTDNGKEFKNDLLNTYCLNQDIKLIHSSPYHPQTNGACEVTHKEIQKYICNEFISNKKNFNIEDSLFEIIKIHNNKKHTTTKRIPKDIRDIEDETEIDNIKQEIIKTLARKNKNIDIINFEKFYVIDDKNLCIKKNKFLDKKDNKTIKSKKIIKSNKIPITIIENSSKEDIFLIEIKKTIGILEEGEIYRIHISNIEEVEENLWNNLL